MNCFRLRFVSVSLSKMAKFWHSLWPNILGYYRPKGPNQRPRHPPLQCTPPRGPFFSPSRSLRCHFCLILFVLADGAYTQRTAILKNSFVVICHTLRPFLLQSFVVAPCNWCDSQFATVSVTLFAFVFIVRSFVSMQYSHLVWHIYISSNICVACDGGECRDLKL